MNSLLSAIRAAVRPGTAPDSPLENVPDAMASLIEAPQIEAPTPGGDMSANQTAPGAAASAAAGTLAAVAAAASGGTDGYKAAMDRINALVSAEGIKGDAKRMSAALDLANASPDMAADAVIAFVKANVPSAGADAGTIAPAGSAAQPSKPAQSYEDSRAAAANLAMPPAGASAKGKSEDSLSPAAVFASRRAATKGA